MKNLVLSFLVVLLTSCNTSNYTNILQTVSSNAVIIRPDIYSPTRDSLKIEIPLEFTIINNTDRDFDFLTLGLLYNNNIIPVMDDFDITDGQNNGLSRFDLKIKKSDSLHFISYSKISYITASDAKKIFKNYSINNDVGKFRDSVKLVPYNQFRKDFPEVIKELERIPDSLEITTSNKTDKTFTSQRIKINW